MHFIKTTVVISTMLFLVACGGGGGCSSGASCAAAGSGTGTFTATPDSAVSVAIGTGDKIEVSAQDIKYKERFAVTVSDTSGRPVVGAEVSASTIMVGFYKGEILRDDKNKPIASGIYNLPITAPFTLAGPVLLCSSEDLNNNDKNDPGEDINQDGRLTPAKADVVAVIEGSKITNDQGIVYVVVEYPKIQASWIRYKLQARAAVKGTEGIAMLEQDTGYAAGDDSKDTTPFLRSPYGVTPGCSNKF